ncbi:MAG: glycosyl hydrolase [Cytophagales bacterium]|nr:glycosyl hydrolase [Bernardetiaceae bacterium]MDW8209889.1 glycosyl hydrolase [Cytophagales bacterium]
MVRTWLLMVILWLSFKATAQIFSKKPDSKIILSPQETFQTIESFGGNFYRTQYADKAEDAIGICVLNRLKPQSIRFHIPLSHWEPRNDNPFTDQVYWPGFKDVGVVESLFRFLRTMKKQYGVQTFIGTIWDLPEWLVTNPHQKTQRKISPEMYPELAESIATFLRHAKGKYGVEVTYISINEPDAGNCLSFSPQELANFIKLAMPIIEKMGVSVKFIVGDVRKIDAISQYLNQLWAEESLRQYMGPIAFHSWQLPELPNAILEKIPTIAKQYQLPLWCTEVGYNAHLGNSTEHFSTWQHAWETARTYHRLLRYSNVTSAYYWTFQDHYPLASPDTLTIYPAFHYLNRLVKHFKPSITLINAITDDADLWVLAGKDNKGKIVMQIINIAYQPREIEISNWNAQQVMMDSANNDDPNFEKILIKLKSGKLRVTLPAQSINFFSTL